MFPYISFFFTTFGELSANRQNFLYHQGIEECIRNGDLIELKKLLQTNSVAVNLATGDLLNTPLHIATRKGYSEAVRLLLDAGNYRLERFIRVLPFLVSLSKT